MSIEIDLRSGFISKSKHLDVKLDLRGQSEEDLLEQLKMMQLIRICENKLAEMRKQGKIGGPVHLGAGQEAIAVGISKYLGKSDRIFSAHRSHAHLLPVDTTSQLRHLLHDCLSCPACFLYHE